MHAGDARRSGQSRWCGGACQQPRILDQQPSLNHLEMALILLRLDRRELCVCGWEDRRTNSRRVGGELSRASPQSLQSSGGMDSWQ